ncbi:MAG TPA: hypothetical protein VFO49_11810 [Nocardioides sp.]|nr:hypothetical protein [Nocardioides sp.]
MTNWLEVLVYVIAGTAAVVALVHLARDRPVEDGMYLLLGIAELLLLVQLVLGSVDLANTDRDVSGALFVSYLVGVTLVLPIGAFWSLAERNRAGTAVLLLAILTVVGLQLRLHAIWAGAGA